MATVFSNTDTIPAASNDSCAGGYIAAAGATRYLRLIMTPSSTNLPLLQALLGGTSSLYMSKSSSGGATLPSYAGAPVKIGPHFI